MPSSTSSSEHVRFLTGVATAVVGAILALELLVRGLGVLPSVVDSKDLWSRVRGDVYGPDELVVVGGSRSLLDVWPPTLERLRPGLAVRQLSLGGTWGIAVLRDLAADPHFTGRVLVSVRGDALDPVRWDSQQDYVDYYHHDFNANERLNVALTTELSERLALKSPAVALPRLAASLVDEGELPRQWLIFHGDRSVEAHFDRWKRVPDAIIRAVFENEFRRHPICPPDRWLAATAPVEGWIDAIQARGGRVAIVRFPTSRGHWRVDEQYYPRARYWDPFAARTAAVAIHFRDDPVLSALELPDATHLGHREAMAFTKRLGVLLEQRGFFDRAPRRPARSAAFGQPP